MSSGYDELNLRSGTVRALLVYAIVRTVAALNWDPLPPGVLDGLADLGIAAALFFMQRRIPRRNRR